MTRSEFITRWNKLQLDVEQELNTSEYQFYTCNVISWHFDSVVRDHYSSFGPNKYLRIWDFDWEFGEANKPLGNELRMLFLEFWFNFVLDTKAYRRF